MYCRTKTYWIILLACCVLMYCVLFYCVFKKYPVWISAEILPSYLRLMIFMPCLAISRQLLPTSLQIHEQSFLVLYSVFKLVTLYHVTRYNACAWRRLASYETTLYLDRCWWAKDKTVNLSYIYDKFSFIIYIYCFCVRTSSGFCSIGTYSLFCRVLHSDWTQKGT
jgi:hypothetical protein